MAELKQRVLKDSVMELSQNLGDPRRYFPRLRTAGLLDQSDCETIDHEVTTRDKVVKFVDIISEGRQGRHGEPAFDVFVEALINERVHLFIAKKLQGALSKALKEELEPEDSPGDEITAMVADGTRSDTHQALDRGTHVPRLQLNGSETDLTTIQPQPHKQIVELRYYPMTNVRHGVALIVNNEQFQRHPRREGSDRDEANLVQTWLFLGYRVEVRRNLTSVEMVEIFEDIDSFIEVSDKSAGEENTVSHDSFVSCFLSHGSADDIMGTDSKSVKMADVECMIGRSTKLQSKPKLFFVQACRGPRAGAEVQSDDDSEYRHRITNRSDMHFSYATVPGNKAYRNITKGSWFVTELCKTLCEFAPSHTLHEMQHRVNLAVPGNTEYKVPFSDPGGAEYAQQPANAGTMTKCMHFFDSLSAPES